MNEVITIGVDLAKNVFQVHGVDADGAVVVRRPHRRFAVRAFIAGAPTTQVVFVSSAIANSSFILASNDCGLSIH